MAVSRHQRRCVARRAGRTTTTPWIGPHFLVPLASSPTQAAADGGCPPECRAHWQRCWHRVAHVKSTVLLVIAGSRTPARARTAAAGCSRLRERTPAAWCGGRSRCTPTHPTPSLRRQSAARMHETTGVSLAVTNAAAAQDCLRRAVVTATVTTRQVRDHRPARTRCPK